MNFIFKKNLGQHFLKDIKTLEKIVGLKQIKNKTVVEVGPGNGALTKMILKQTPKKLYIIEKDVALKSDLSVIKKRYPENLEIFFDDALKFNFNKLSNEKLLLIANLPYNISNTLLLNLIKSLDSFVCLIVMVQKEVAERLSASVSSKSYGRISILMQLHSEIKKHFDVTPDKFIPKPKVISSVIEINPFIKHSFDLEKLDKLLKIAFKQRRKTIRNNLRNLNLFTEKKLVDCGINPQLRPQDIKPEEYIRLSNFLFQ